MNRRQWIVAASGVAVGVFSNRRARAQTTIEALTERVSVLRGIGGNVVICSSADGLILTDSGAGAGIAGVLGDVAGSAAVHTLVNTHWHPEQTGGNAELGAVGAHIIAHAKTRQRLAAGYYLRSAERYTAPLPAPGVPQEAFFTRLTRSIGGETIECEYLLEAHTDGDICVRFANANVVAAGDVLSPQTDPVIDWFGGGWIGGRLDSLARLLAISDAQTRFVPSTGPVVGRDYVQQELTLMTTIFERMVELIRQGMTAEDCIEAGVMDDLGREFDDPLTFIDATHRSLWAHHNTLSHDIV